MSEVTLISEDGIKFQVSLSVVRCIGLFKNLLDLNAGASLPPLQVPNVTSLILDKIIEYLENYVSSRDTMAAIGAAGGATGARKTQAAPLKVKTTISSIVAASNGASRGTGDDDDDDDFPEESATVLAGDANGTADFEMPATDDSDDFLDFASFDDQSLRLFTPFEQSFFASLDIPTLIEITKVRLKKDCERVF